MYIEKEYLINKIDEFCEIYNIKMSFSEKYKFSSIISLKLDEERFLTCDEFLELLEHNEHLELYNEILFNDEIINIEELDYIDMIDFNVSGNKLFYANNILTHNSAVGSTDADNGAVSDSLGSVMTADFLLFLLQTPEMKENKEIIFKITKNRYTGRTDTWIMNIDYEHMRFSDVITENSLEHTKLLEELVKEKGPDNALDFGDSILPNIVTAEKIKSAEEFATNEIKEIAKNDIEILMQDSQKKKDPLSDNTEDLFRELGIL